MKKGFTLIELLIVIAILGLLAALVVPNIIGQGERAKEKLVCIQEKSLKNALDSFKVTEGVYPTTEEGLKALIKNPNPEKAFLLLHLKYQLFPSTSLMPHGEISFLPLICAFCIYSQSTQPTFHNPEVLY